MDNSGASANVDSTAITTVGEANPLHKHHAALLPDGRLALILDLSGALSLTRTGAQIFAISPSASWSPVASTG